MESVSLPNDINKAIIVLNPILLSILLSYNYISEMNFNPLIFFLICITSMSIGLCMWGMKGSIINSFNKRYGNRINADFQWYRSFNNYPRQVDITYMISILGFILLWMFGIAIQINSMN